MKNLAERKVGSIVSENFKASTVLTSHHIDFCCGGGVTLREACQTRNISVDAVIKELKVALETPAVRDYQHLELDELLDEIVNTHHKYVEATAPALNTYLNKLVSVHGERHPELLKIKDLFSEGTAALTEHMKKEELMLFPYISAMVEAKRKGFALSRPHFEDVENPISLMESEHENEGDRFKKIAELSSNYTCPKDGCQTYQVTYAMLKEFEEDLHKHVHLENNILFPKTRALFKEFNF